MAEIWVQLRGTAGDIDRCYSGIRGENFDCLLCNCGGHVLFVLWSGSDMAVTTRLIAQPAEIDLERRCLCSREWLEAVRGKHIVKIKPCDSFCFVNPVRTAELRYVQEHGSLAYQQMLRRLFDELFVSA